MGKQIVLTEAEYYELRDEYGGICRACMARVYCDMEPDAEGYRCEACGKDAVAGIDNLVIDETVVVQ